MTGWCTRPRFEMKLGPRWCRSRPISGPPRRPAFSPGSMFFLRDPVRMPILRWTPKDLTFDHVILQRSRGGPHHLGECRHRLQPLQNLTKGGPVCPNHAKMHSGAIRARISPSVNEAARNMDAGFRPIICTTKLGGIICTGISVAGRP